MNLVTKVRPKNRMHGHGKQNNNKYTSSTESNKGNIGHTKGFF